LSEVLDLLVQHGDDARLLAGGQTLLATLNMRLSEPTVLIDLHAVPELRGITLGAQCLRIGAMVTHSDIESSPLVAQHAPLLSQAAPHIAHRAIRNQGTFGGSIAYADPAAEWPACLLALDGVVVVEGPGGEHRITASDFFTGLYSTALAADDIIVACEIPLSNKAQRSAFTELARRHGDYAVVGLAATTLWSKTGFDQLRLSWLGVGSMPFRSRATEQVLQGKQLNDNTLALATQALVSELDPQADLTHSAAAKQHLAGVLLKRVLSELAAPVSAAH
jgi:carbon-monoxide dehydrogenase medium subunit